MPTLMPSIFKYFITVGAILFVGLVGLNAVMESGGPGPRIVQDSPKAKLVRHDPRASLVERLREEEAAQKASGKAEALPVQQPATAAISTAPAAPAAPARPAVTQVAAVAQPQPMKQAVAEPVPVAPAVPAAADHQSAPAALTGLPAEDDTHSVRVAQEKAAAEKARKKRVARDRARTKAIEDASAARQQDQYYYGQRSAYASPPRPAFGPFGQNQGSLFGGGWGKGW
jgi:hypothetical protein